jgi:hypothetical protein
LICFVQNRREKKSLRSDATDTHISDVSGDGHEGDYAAANLIVSRRSPSPSIREALEEQACNSKNSLLNYFFHPILLWESCLQIPYTTTRVKEAKNVALFSSAQMLYSLSLIV